MLDLYRERVLLLYFEVFVEEIIPTELGESLPSVEVHVVGQGEWPFLHDVLKPSEEHSDGRRLVLLPGWFEIFLAQVPELVGVEV